MRCFVGIWLVVALLLAACDRFAPPAATVAGTPAVAVLPTDSATPPLVAASPSGTPSAAALAPTATPTATFTAPPPSPTTPAPTETATSDVCAARHTVLPGERLFRIGLRYGVGWQEIARANNLADPALIYPGQVLCIPAGGSPPAAATATGTAPPAASAAPTGTTGAGQPAILSFAASPQEIGPGGTITLVWSTSGGASARLIEPICCASNGANLSREVPLNGSLQVSTHGSVARDTLIYSLLLTGSGGSSAPIQSVAVRLPCPDRYFFDPPAGSLECPASAPITTQAAEQAFEGGRMIWLGAQGVILALFGDGAPPNGPAQPPNGYASFPDTWAPGEPESDPALVPPEGRLQPVRGFGKVWRGELVPGQTVRDALGWALGPEQPYTGAVQRPWQTCLMLDGGGAARSCSGPAPIQFLRAADGRLIRVAEFGALGRHTVAQWQFWAP